MEKMKDFPGFMRNRKNAIAEGSPDSGIEGYVYDGVDGSQIIHWTCGVDGVSEEHCHPFGEYMVVVSGSYEMAVNGKKHAYPWGMNSMCLRMYPTQAGLQRAPGRYTALAEKSRQKTGYGLALTAEAGNIFSLCVI